KVKLPSKMMIATKRYHFVIFCSDFHIRARSYPRHACPLYVVVFMHLHDMSKSPPVLACLSQTDPQTIMRTHAA
ncbi:TPA: hypothetical protein ACHJTJ_004164, partial [Escherichia coli]